jgi:hypothetical protein
MEDLHNPKWMYLKAALFIAIGFIPVCLLLAANPTLKTGVLLFLVIWSFCRAYYFAFYVIDRYIDPKFRFSGLFSVIRYLVTNRAQR